MRVRAAFVCVLLVGGCELPSELTVVAGTPTLPDPSLPEIAVARLEDFRLQPGDGAVRVLSWNCVGPTECEHRYVVGVAPSEADLEATAWSALGTVVWSAPAAQTTTYRALVQARGVGGTPGPVARFEWTLDTVGPSLSVATSDVPNGKRYVPSCNEACEVRVLVRQDLGTAAWSAWGQPAPIDVVAPTLLEAGPYAIDFEVRDAAGNAGVSQRLTAYVKPRRVNAQLTSQTKIDLPAIAARRGRTVAAMLEHDAWHFLPTTFAPGDRELFVTYSTAAVSRPTNYLAEFGYVNGVAWDSTTSGTLITRQHIVMADHYQRGVGATLYFHDTAGNVITRTLISKQSVPGGLDPDIAVGKLDQPVPDSIDVYPVLATGGGLIASDLANHPYLVTDQDRRVFVHKTSGISGRRFYATNYSTLPAFMSKSLVGGDSGHACFIIVGGHLVLMATHTYAGYGFGPYYGDATSQTAIQNIINSL